MDETDKAPDTMPGGWLVSKPELMLAKLVTKVDSRCPTIAVSAERTEVTNGHYLVRIDGARPDAKEYPKPAGSFEPCNGRTLVPADAALAIAKVLPKRLSITVLCNAIVGKSEIAATDLEGWTNRKFEPNESFPNTDKVMPQVEKVESVASFNAEYVRDLMAAALSFGNGRMTAVTFELYGPDNAARLTAKCEDGRTFTAVLMPVRA